MNRTRRGYWILIALFSVAVVVVMAMIFYFSSENGTESTATSNGVTGFVLKLIKPDFEGLTQEERAAFFSKASFYVRKAAHFSEYFLLGLFSSLLLIAITNFCDRRMGALFVIPPIFSFLYAVIDEGHQTFVGGRAGQFTDVLIDTAGALFATGIVLVFYLIINRRGKA